MHMSELPSGTVAAVAGTVSGGPNMVVCGRTWPLLMPPASASTLTGHGHALGPLAARGNRLVEVGLLKMHSTSPEPSIASVAASCTSGSWRIGPSARSGGWRAGSSQRHRHSWSTRPEPRRPSQGARPPPRGARREEPHRAPDQRMRRRRRHSLAVLQPHVRLHHHQGSRATTAPRFDYVLASRPLIMKYPLTTVPSAPVTLPLQLHPPTWCLAPTPCTATGRRRLDTRSWAMHWSTN
jgi:hypothetical protein